MRIDLEVVVVSKRLLTPRGFAVLEPFTIVKCTGLAHLSMELPQSGIIQSQYVRETTNGFGSMIGATGTLGARASNSNREQGVLEHDPPGIAEEATGVTCREMLSNALRRLLAEVGRAGRTKPRATRCSPVVLGVAVGKGDHLGFVLFENFRWHGMEFWRQTTSVLFLFEGAVPCLEFVSASGKVPIGIPPDVCRSRIVECPPPSLCLGQRSFPVVERDPPRRNERERSRCRQQGKASAQRPPERRRSTPLLQWFFRPPWHLLLFWLL